MERQVSDRLSQVAEKIHPVKSSNAQNKLRLISSHHSQDDIVVSKASEPAEEKQVVLVG